MMKHSWIIIFLCLLGIFSLSIFFIFKNTPTNPISNSQQIHEIIINDNGFLPNEISIQSGDSIKFATSTGRSFWPASDLHPTHGIYPEFDPLSPIDPNSSWTFKFVKPGRWTYHDHLQPFFKGIIIVKP